MDTKRILLIIILMFSFCGCQKTDNHKTNSADISDTSIIQDTVVEVEEDFIVEQSNEAENNENIIKDIPPQKPEQPSEQNPEQPSEQKPEQPSEQNPLTAGFDDNSGVQEPSP
ncbi:MAG: hypothetical protein GX800_06620, partial [Clostridiaceae bacterium]|nr:hypothetical protein [Clostridiaceae bacterium]